MTDSSPAGPHSDEELRAVTVGELEPLAARLGLSDYDKEWPRVFDAHASALRAALGARAQQIEHVGSTAVPALAAKPIVDVLLVVEDSADESAYAGDLERAGYVLRIREPEWHEHRVFKPRDGKANIHVFSREASEISRMLRFRDWLRAHDEDRFLYERTKRELVQRDWKYTQHYANAKSAVVEQILERSE
jgi:GrpB-like predicted nucleotidyltransferase (UPF0157 family)